MRFVKDFVKWFFYITTAVLIICAFHFGVSEGDVIEKDTLWQILLSGFLTAGVTVFLLPRDNRVIRPLAQFFVHYAALSAVMLVCGHWFGWLEYNVAGIAMMLVSVAVVYLICFGIYYLIDLREADKINRRLKEKYGEK